MSMQLSPYPAYRDSGVPWLGEVPAHWEVMRLKRAARLSPGKAEARDLLDRNQEAVFLPMEHVGTNGSVRYDTVRPIAELWNGFTYFRRDDVIVAKITPCFENGKGACLDGLPTEAGFGSTEFTVLRPLGSMLPRFLYRLTTVAQFRELGADAMTGAAGQQRVPVDFIGQFLVPVPPVEEQQAIVRFLAHMDSRINRLVRAKRRLIALLNEQKQAIIHRAVTRGLDPDVRLKPSGIDWLGDVPEHWTVLRLRDVAVSMQTGPFGSQLHANEYTPGGTPVINPSHMKAGRIEADSTSAIGPDKVRELKRHLLKRSDIIFARRGELGRCAVVTEQEEDWICGTGSLRMRPRSEIVNSAYLARLLLTRGVGEWLSLQSVGSTMDNLNTGILSRLPIPLPPRDEQDSIVGALPALQSPIDASRDRVQREIDLLREYRTRLIADAVTGKLDVRGVALPALDEDVGEGLELESEEAEGEGEGEDGAFGDEDAEAGDE